MTRELAGAPGVGVEVPQAVVMFADGAATTPVWRNSVGGLTFRVERPVVRGGACFVKWNPTGSGESLADEELRLGWLRDRFSVPRVVASGSGADGEWLATTAIDAASAVAPEWKAHPDAAARAMGSGLRRLHDAVAVAGCPFDWSVASRIAVAEATGLVVPEHLHHPPSVDRLVVCHGDPCAPNTLIDVHGEFAGIVDVARVGVADRWADLAVGSWSLEWNFGTGFEPAFFEAYGVDPDIERIAYYRALWDAT